MPSVASRGRTHGRRTMHEINMVPFIDVMLVLLIIFMVTAPLITPSMIDLPSIGKAARQPDHIVQVIIGADDLLELRAKDQTSHIPLAELAQRVRSIPGVSSTGNAGNTSNLAVVISADKNVRYERVVNVMDTLQRAGIARVGLSVQLANSSSDSTSGSGSAATNPTAP